MIELSQVSKTFNGTKTNAFRALREIDLVIRFNEVTLFKGPSGSGKTTLLSIIGCMSRPTSGRIWLDKREITSLPERFSAETRRKTFGFIFQHYNLIKGLSALENVLLPAYPEGLKHRIVHERAMALLKKMKVAERAHQKVESLSGGEQQRVAIARALINEPSVIIADEPTAHLDTDLARDLMEVFSSLKEGGKTLIVASHDPLVFESPWVDRVVSMRDGAILQGEEKR